MLTIRNIQKQFGSQTALADIELTIREGEFFSLLGPSGCGKTTLLRVIAGLEDASSGQILWRGARVDQLPARERPFNMVFQKYALFPHLSVAENIAFGLRLKKIPDAEIKGRVAEALSLVQLSSLAERKPETLSGGQQQRVALARALVNRPACVLLDEPLGALDQKLRESMQNELRLLQRRLKLTFILVTHDQEEAMALSDRVAIMNEGRIEQVGTPFELFERPSSAFCARFIGGRNEFRGLAKPIDKNLYEMAFASVRTEARSICGDLESRREGPVAAFISPEKVRLHREPGLGRAWGEVLQTVYRGARSEITVSLGSDSFVRALLESSIAAEFKSGEIVHVEFPANDTLVYWAGET